MGWCQTAAVTAASGADAALGNASPRPSPASPRTRFYTDDGTGCPASNSAAGAVLSPTPPSTPARRGTPERRVPVQLLQLQRAVGQLIAELHAVETGLIPATNLAAP